MRRRRALRTALVSAACALGIVACEPAADVVARAVPDGGTEGAAQVRDSGLSQPTFACVEPSRKLVVPTALAQVHVFDLERNVEIGTAIPTCSAPEAVAAAVDHAGTVWIIQPGGANALTVDAVTRACEKRALSLVATALAFVGDPTTGREVLYAVVDGMLVSVDESTYVVTTIGKIGLAGVRSLAGTSDGHLFAFAGDAVVTVADIHLPTRKSKPRGRSNRPMRRPRSSVTRSLAPASCLSSAKARMPSILRPVPRSSSRRSRIRPSES